MPDITNIEWAGIALTISTRESMPPGTQGECKGASSLLGMANITHRTECMRN